jgi:hypothetical protein
MNDLVSDSQEIKINTKSTKIQINVFGFRNPDNIQLSAYKSLCPDSGIRTFFIFGKYFMSSCQIL